MTERGKRILGAEGLQVTRENPRNLKEKDGDGQRERERESYVLLQTRECRAEQCRVGSNPYIHTVPLHLQPVLVNTKRSKARAIPGNNTTRHEYEFIHKQIFKMGFFSPQI
jgi:hypothetical protein